MSHSMCHMCSSHYTRNVVQRTCHRPTGRFGSTGADAAVLPRTIVRLGSESRLAVLQRPRGADSASARSEPRVPLRPARPERGVETSPHAASSATARTRPHQLMETLLPLIVIGPLPLTLTFLPSTVMSPFFLRIIFADPTCTVS